MWNANEVDVRPPGRRQYRFKAGGCTILLWQGGWWFSTIYYTHERSNFSLFDLSKTAWAPTIIGWHSFPSISRESSCFCSTPRPQINSCCLGQLHDQARRWNPDGREVHHVSRQGDALITLKLIIINNRTRGGALLNDHTDDLERSSSGGELRCIITTRRSLSNISVTLDEKAAFFLEALATREKKKSLDS